MNLLIEHIHFFDGKDYKCDFKRKNMKIKWTIVLLKALENDLES